MPNSIFITSTDTSVGKTLAARALIQSLISIGKTVIGFKPVARGEQHTPEGWQNQDALQLQAISSIPVDYHLINPIVTDNDGYIPQDYPVSYSLLSDNLKALSDMADYIVVEGTGGWRSLLHDLRPLSQWVVQEKLPVILVVGIQPGCVNHALLTAQAVITDGLPLAGWLANRINPGVAHYAELISVLTQKIPAPRIGELPYLPRQLQRNLEQYINFAMLGKALNMTDNLSRSGSYKTSVPLHDELIAGKNRRVFSQI